MEIAQNSMYMFSKKTLNEINLHKSATPPISSPAPTPLSFALLSSPRERWIKNPINYNYASKPFANPLSPPSPSPSLPPLALPFNSPRQICKKAHQNRDLRCGGGAQEEASAAQPRRDLGARWARPHDIKEREAAAGLDAGEVCEDCEDRALLPAVWGVGQAR